ncbi:MAG TPA: aminoglycoside phosphotransferase family protein [Meiothermus sp.]|jgi:uncharacterized protein (TIGR02172 family)|nr:aminoglycoside phosphotransferase family protein [Meiothermus sp.]
MLHLGQGREAEVYAWGESFVLKLFWPEFSREDVELEADIAAKVWAAGVPSPKVEDLLEMEGRWGIVYERIFGVSLIEYVWQNPDQLFATAGLLGSLHRRIHQVAAPRGQPAGGWLPSQRERFVQRIRASKLSEALKHDLLAHIGGLPDGSTLCHGDFHPDNVLVNGQIALSGKNAWIIDWPNAVQGNPLADVARTGLLLLYSALPPNLPARRELLARRKRFYQVYLEHYLGSAPKADWEELQAWMPVVAAVRLREGIEEEEPTLMRLIRQGLRRR